MDWKHPVETLIPGAQGRLLSTLASTTRGLSVRAAADLSAVSVAQASRLLRTLEKEGLVQRYDVPPAAVYSLQREHLVSQLVIKATGLRTQLFEALIRELKKVRPAPLSVVLFGSFARGGDDLESDIDLLFVKPQMKNDDAWTNSLWSAAEAIQEISGNRVEVIVWTASEASKKLRRAGRGLGMEIRKDGIALLGETYGLRGIDEAS